MYLIVGLGNPESDYSNTRHNMGFDVINKITNITGIKVLKSKFEALYGMGEINGNKVILVKPLLFSYPAIHPFLVSDFLIMQRDDK